MAPRPRPRLPVAAVAVAGVPRGALLWPLCGYCRSRAPMAVPAALRPEAWGLRLQPWAPQPCLGVAQAAGLAAGATAGTAPGAPAACLPCPGSPWLSLLPSGRRPGAAATAGLPSATPYGWLRPQAWPPRAVAEGPVAPLPLARCSPPWPAPRATVGRHHAGVGVAAGVGPAVRPASAAPGRPAREASVAAPAATVRPPRRHGPRPLVVPPPGAGRGRHQGQATRWPGQPTWVPLP